jgi:hypothetical protein
VVDGTWDVLCSIALVNLSSVFLPFSVSIIPPADAFDV